MTPKPLAIATGDPAGVGPEVAVRAAIGCGLDERVLLFGDAVRLETLVRRAAGPQVRDRGMPSRIRCMTIEQAASMLPGEIGLVHTGDVAEAIVQARAPTPEGGRAQLVTLEAALGAVRSGHARALVTGPISKEAVQLGGVAFVGHTEHLARSVGLADDQVTMLFLGPRLNVALVTTHLAIADAPAAITQARVERAILHLAQALQASSGASTHAVASTPVRRIAVTGLNPHAGEAGLFGDEESRAVTPAIMARVEDCRALGSELTGPLPAETAFRQAADGRFAGVVAMLHDQGTIASKLLDWGQAVNVTWGLPFVRTSVDHGVGYAAARDGSADAEGMQAAVRMAQRLTAV